MLIAANKDGRTPLHWASENGHLEVAKLLLANNANVDAADKDGRTPLHFACQNGHLEVAKLLLANNADPTIRDAQSQTPFMIITPWTGAERDELYVLLKSAAWYG